MKNVNKLEKVFMKALGHVAIAAATVNANTACAFIMFQPVPPDKLKSLKKM